MKVKDLMQPRVFTIAPSDTIDRVFFLIHYEKIRHIPVMERGKIVGIVSDRDLYKALGPRTCRHGAMQGENDTSLFYVISRNVRHIMRRGVVTIAPEAEATEAAAMMAKRKIGALPVVSGSKLVGIVTSTDLLLAYSRTGACAAVS
jgi:acetoin utilization protein AcuB